MATGQAGHGIGRRGLTTWEQTRAWRSARRAMTQEFLTEGKAARSRFSTAWTTHAEAAGDLALQAAIDRVNAAAKAKMLVASALPEIAARDPIIRAGASTINLNNDTITLGNGTVIDIKTGAKIDFTV